MFDFLRGAFRWHTVLDTGVWRYQENAATGRRRARKIGAGHQAVDRAWLDHAEAGPPVLPKGNRSAVRVAGAGQPKRRVEAVAIPRQKPLWRI